MKGFIYYKLTRMKLLIISLMLLVGCAGNPEQSSFFMGGIPQLAETADDIVEPRKLNFTFQYKQVELTKNQRNRLIYLYDWENGAIISYGKAKADNDYSALSIGHQRVQAVVKALDKNQHVTQINYDPTMHVDLVVIEETIPNNVQPPRDKSSGLLESTRL